MVPTDWMASMGRWVRKNGSARCSPVKLLFWFFSLVHGASPSKYLRTRHIHAKLVFAGVTGATGFTGVHHFYAGPDNVCQVAT